MIIFNPPLPKEYKGPSLPWCNVGIQEPSDMQKHTEPLKLHVDQLEDNGPAWCLGMILQHTPHLARLLAKHIKIGMVPRPLHDEARRKSDGFGRLILTKLGQTLPQELGNVLPSRSAPRRLKLEFPPLLFQDSGLPERILALGKFHIMSVIMSVITTVTTIHRNQWHELLKRIWMVKLTQTQNSKT